ncbi:MAG: HAMP domain-containing protein, partial [Caldilineaceae bacterium SB0665_bin_25]|nr:HAMP domain-containing protein [Caldilineaceae bacterium SB0665_bin_25]
MFRSLAVKLTLAFLAVGVSGALLVAAISGQRTRLEFDRFVSQQSDSSVVAVLLLGFYEENNYSWEGIEQWLNNEPSLRFLSRLIVLTDSNRRIIYSYDPGQEGQNVSALEMERGIPVFHDDEHVGTAYFRNQLIPDEALPGFSPESFFIHSVNQTTALAAFIAALLALALGILLSRALTRPLRELTIATEEMAAGQLGKQVDEHPQDEIGKLASSFNKMSKDLA